MDLRVNPGRLKERIENVARFGKDPAGGWSRFAFTEEEKHAREFVTGLMEKAGMQVRLDAAGNLFGKRPGSAPELPSVAAGSHIDTVINGGMFDGVTGVIAAVEAVQVMHENDIETAHPLEVIVFANEEGARFDNALWGSRAMLGIIQEEELYGKKDKDGTTVAEAMRAAGFDPAEIEKAKVEGSRFKAFFEVHPEQSVVLETNQVSLGVVEGIAGTAWLKAVLRGKPDHAGATPMDLRRDALAASAAVILDVERIAAQEVGRHTVATVGQLTLKPGGINIIPGEVEMSFDIRDVSIDDREKAVELIKDAVEEVCQMRGIAVEIEEIGKVMPVSLSEEMADLIESICMSEGISCCRLVSGAGHDSQVMAFLTKVGMIFVPSVNGISHNPEEKTDWQDVANGAQVLLQAMYKLAQ